MVDSEPGTPLLWVIRDNLKLTGAEIDDDLDGNACCCASDQRIRAAILRAADIVKA
ncbi:MAG: hypothetical protein AB8B58_14235 [Roseobacter sp.]